MGQLFNLLRDTDVLAWDFFLGRLDLLSMEAHVGLENAADLGAFPTGKSILSVIINITLNTFIIIMSLAPFHLRRR